MPNVRASVVDIFFPGSLCRPNQNYAQLPWHRQRKHRGLICFNKTIKCFYSQHSTLSDGKVFSARNSLKVDFNWIAWEFSCCSSHSSWMAKMPKTMRPTCAKMAEPVEKLCTSFVSVKRCARCSFIKCSTRNREEKEIGGSNEKSVCRYGKQN